MMGLEFDFFNSLEHLEPKCPKCMVKVEYGINTEYDESKKAHVCINCGFVLK